MSGKAPRWAILFLLGLMVAAGCARSPEAQQARHLGRGDRYFGREQYRDAIIEYRNVLRIEPTNVRALQQLGFAHYQLGETGQAFRYLLKAQQLSPENLDVRLKLGAIYLLGHRPAEAREEATYVLEKAPKNLEALLLLAGAASAPGEADVAIRRLEEARADLGDRAKLHLALGTLYLRKQDPAAAERAFRDAVVREPQSAEAHMALGSFYLDRRDIALAEREFTTAADLAPIGSPARLKLTDFYLFVRKPEEAKRILQEVVDKAPDYLPARRRLAEIAFAEGQYAESAETLERLLTTHPSDLDALLLRGRVRLARRQTTEAIQDFQQVLSLEPRLAAARYELALAQLQAGNIEQAKTELKEATTVAPNFTEATLKLAELNLQTGARQAAIEDLEKLVAKQPRAVAAYVLLGTAYLAKREPARALDAYRQVAVLAPRDPRGPYLVGLALRSAGKYREAEKQFEASLALAPGYVEAVAQLAAMALADKQPDAALSRVKTQIARVPKSGGLQDLLGRVYRVRGEKALAEAAYLKALALELGLVGPYLELASLYAAQGKYDQALGKLNEGLRVNPDNVVALMLSGTLYHRKGEIAKAREAYEKVLALNPRFAPAANNLAWLYLEQGGNLERALQFAQTAKELAPDEPHISDTLGWIFYKRGVYQGALTLLKESASKLPENPEVQYHLGMAYWKVGDKEQAKQVLRLAATSPTNYVGKDEAKKVLGELN